MKANLEEKSISLDACELVTWLLCRRFGAEADTGAGTVLDRYTEADEDFAPLLPEGEEIPLEKSINRGAYKLIISGKAARITEDSLFHVAAFEGIPSLPRAAVKRRARAIGFLLLSLCKDPPKRLTAVYFDRGSGKSESVTEEPKKEDIDRFFERACKAVDAYAASIFEGMGKRRPSMAALRFPFPARRQGQGELMQAVYRTARRGGRLFASAPTGIGKTMSTLYPAVRALGEGEIDKVFYLTPKATVAQAAADAVQKLADQGAFIRAVRLYAKEIICENGVVCREDHSLCRMHGKSESAYDRAVAELCLLPSSHPVIVMRDLLRVAKKHGVCPHELAFAYSERADVIIGDYHYLFDPHIALRRYFTGRGDYLFLVDEAHNLVERGREMYSATLKSTHLTAWKMWAREHSLRLLGMIEKAEERFITNLHAMLSEALHTDGHGGECAYLHTKTLTEEITAPLERLVERAEEDALKRRIPEDERTNFFTLFAPVRRMVEAYHAHDGDCVWILTLEDGVYTLTSYCINPGARLAACMDKGKGAVLFSATMEPLHYYESVLGADRHSRSLSLPSPFPEENLAVAIVDNISLRYLDRDATLAEIVSVIGITVHSHVGNYMVFCPSFEYLDRLSAFVEAKMPDLAVIRQTRTMSRADREAFLSALSPAPERSTVAFAVMGGVFSESVDLTGDRLVGSIVIGVGLPGPSLEREACADFYDEKCDSGKEYAYLYPGMNRVWQAAGRVIRTETDRGVLVLIDDRFKDPFYRGMIPAHLRRRLRFTGSVAAIAELFRRFWQNIDLP
ncbi:MAG: ATP-dependent DNA helicase [Clostridia bacterium]|nr:ATP-dependent DNA helicase [Clostridia bacterium]